MQFSRHCVLSFGTQRCGLSCHSLWEIKKSVLFINIKLNKPFLMYITLQQIYYVHSTLIRGQAILVSVLAYKLLPQIGGETIRLIEALSIYLYKYLCHKSKLIMKVLKSYSIK